ncbi:MAG: 4'-phosphopantetheinyl transferase superfamily protein [Chitinophaga sp.]|uniref:4'-phosphopantetheinyl transferase family protein n=1 Tax=Chitinophaga sp. TaxID=1869181 RepID=UPI001B276212|nr:4'-phosphopantetheinyl transferase superfamily protein [Chitinophaga sp.]MBO9732443.1 4'-phosphopantetheinyl transferase superfamily protein [Chitinophaga sp.]
MYIQQTAPVIYYTYYNTPLPAAHFSWLLKMLPEQMREKICKFRRWEDAHASLLGRLLLLQALAKANCEQAINNIAYTNYGRPYIPGMPDFSISHSGHLVVCAVGATGRIGIDVEMHAPIQVAEYCNQFSAEEWCNIQHAGDPELVFYKYWTKKEAILKADGRGISLSLSSLHVAENEIACLDGRKWYVNTVDVFENYSCHFGSDIKHHQYALMKVDFVGAKMPV